MEQAAADTQLRKGFGHDALVAFVDQGPDGAQEAVGVLAAASVTTCETATDEGGPSG